MTLIPVEEAVARILAGVEPLEAETVPLELADGRVLAEPLISKRTQPPFPASAMDGYAIHTSDIASETTSLRVVGESAAGRRYQGAVGSGEAVRIFTGAPVPPEADAILIQENAKRDGDLIQVLEAPAKGRYIRPAGLDFSAGEELLSAGRRLDARALSAAAAAGHATLSVRRKPIVALLATGDELVPPGAATGPDQIIASNSVGLASDIRRAGGDPINLGIARDDKIEIADKIREGLNHQADVVITLGGASVGEHDLVAAALSDVGMSLDFWKIAMRPGKPLMSGAIGSVKVLGLPGNPVSGLVCSVLFLEPLIAAMLGTQSRDRALLPAITQTDLPENDRRQDYLRTHVKRDANGSMLATPFPRQDSSMLRVHSQANALLVRTPFAPAAKAGAPCSVILLEPV